MPRSAAKVPQVEVLISVQLLEISSYSLRHVCRCAAGCAGKFLFHFHTLQSILLASPLLYRVRVEKSLGRLTQAADKNQRQEILTRSILQYCIAHPDAKDTVDGILRWWFPASEGQWRVDEVKGALQALTENGWLTSRKVHRAEEIYGINKEKMTEIEKFLSESADAAKEPIR